MLHLELVELSKDSNFESAIDGYIKFIINKLAALFKVFTKFPQKIAIQIIGLINSHLLIYSLCKRDSGLLDNLVKIIKSLLLLNMED